MDAHPDLLRAIGAASFRPEAWGEVLTRLSDVAGARGVAVIPLRGNLQGLRQTESLDALADAYVSTGWATRDYRYRGLAKMLAGQVTVDADFIGWDDLLHEPYYEDFLRPLGFRHFAGFCLRSGDDAWAVTLQRSIDHEPFSAQEQDRLAGLIAPMQAAMTIGRALAESYHQGALDRLDVSETACLLLDRLGLVAHMNKAAEAMLGTALTVTQGIVRLPGREPTRRLQERIRQMLSHPSPAVADDAPVFERRADGFFVFEVLRLPDMDVDAFSRYRGMLLVHRTGGGGLHNVEAFRSMFALSRQEAVLAGALSRSRNLTEAARALNISHETARSQLKSIFGKTGVRSQPELLTLIGDLSLVGR